MPQVTGLMAASALQQLWYAHICQNLDMAHFGSSHRPPAGQRRDSSVMSIASLIDRRGGDGYPRTSGGLLRAAPMGNNAAGASNYPSAWPSYTPRPGIPPGVHPMSPPEGTGDEDDDDDDDDEPDMQSPTSPHGEWHSNALATKSSSREPRPSYTEEQKFFIMWARVVQEKSWTDIEDEFTRIFNQRTKGGLTSVYYRIRKSWKLKEVLSGDPTSSDADRTAVAVRAAHFSRGFLREIGYVM